MRIISMMMEQLFALADDDDHDNDDRVKQIKTWARGNPKLTNRHSCALAPETGKNQIA